MLVTIQNRMLSFLLANGAPVPALMRFSAPVKKHWLGSFSIVLPPSGLRGFVPVVHDRSEQPGDPGAGGREGGYHAGGGGRGGTRQLIWSPPPSPCGVVGWSGVDLLGVASLLPACGMVWVRVFLRWFPLRFLGLLWVFGILIPTMIMMMMMVGTMITKPRGSQVRPLFLGVLCWVGVFSLAFAFGLSSEKL